MVALLGGRTGDNWDLLGLLVVCVGGSFFAAALSGVKPEKAAAGSASSCLVSVFSWASSL